MRRPSIRALRAPLRTKGRSGSIVRHPEQNLAHILTILEHPLRFRIVLERQDPVDGHLQPAFENAGEEFPRLRADLLGSAGEMFQMAAREQNRTGSTERQRLNFVHLPGDRPEKNADAAPAGALDAVVNGRDTDRIPDDIDACPAGFRFHDIEEGLMPVFDHDVGAEASDEFGFLGAADGREDPGALVLGQLDQDMPDSPGPGMNQARTFRTQGGEPVH